MSLYSEYPALPYAEEDSPESKTKKRRRELVKPFAKTVNWGAGIGIGLVTVIAAGTVFPVAWLPFILLIGFAGAFVQYRTYSAMTEKSTKSLFVTGAFHDMERAILVRRFYKHPPYQKILRQQYQHQVHALLVHFKQRLEAEARLQGRTVGAFLRTEAARHFFQNFKRQRCNRWLAVALDAHWAAIHQNPDASVETWMQKISEDAKERCLRKFASHVVDSWYRQKRDLSAQEVFSGCEGFGDFYQSVIRSPESRFKKFLTGFVVLTAALNGFVMAAITYTHAVLAIQSFLVLLFGAAVFWPIVAGALATVFTIAVAYAHAMLIYKMLRKATKENFFKGLAWKVINIFRPKTPFFEMSVLGRIGFVLGCILKLSLFLGVAAMGFLVTFYSGSTLFDQSMEFLNIISQLFVALTTSLIYINGMIAGVLIYLFFLPSALMFAFENSWESVEHLSEFFSDVLLHPSKVIKNALQGGGSWRSPWKWLRLICNSMGIIVALLSLVLHSIGEGVIGGEGLASPNVHPHPSTFQKVDEFFARIVQGLSRFFNVSPEGAVVGAEAVSETLEHGTFVVGGKNNDDHAGDCHHSHDHGAPTSGLSDKLFRFGTWLFRGKKDPSSSKTEEIFPAKSLAVENVPRIAASTGLDAEAVSALGGLGFFAFCASLDQGKGVSSYTHSFQR